MSDASTLLDRQTLYELVWSKPTAYLAREYGISDVALGKMCQGMNVPKPPRGYWAKVRRGQKLVRPPLPPDSTCSRTQVVIQRSKPRPPRPAPLPASPEIPVPAELLRPHQLVARTAALLKQRQPGTDGIVAPYGDDALKIEVSEASRARALLVMDTLLKALEQRGFSVEISKHHKRDTLVTVKGEPLALRLREALRRSAHVMTAEEKKRFLKHGYEPYTRYDFRPSGELRLSAIRLDYRSTEKSWSDGRKRLEQQIGAIVVGLEALAERIRQDRIAHAEARRRSEEEARQREEETKRFEQLRQDAAAWREARLLRRYLRVVEAALPHDQHGADFETWLVRVRERVDRLDPLTKLRK